MNVSVSLWSYVEIINSGKKTIEEVIRHMHSCGVKHVEVLDYFLNSEEKEIAAKKVINELGMKVASYSITNNFVCDEESRKLQVKKAINAIKKAKYFNTNIIRSFAGDVNDVYDFNSGFDLIVKSYKECIPYAKEANVFYCLENHGCLAGKATQVKAIIDAVGSNHLKATTDTGNFLLVGDNSIEAVHYLKEHIGLVHFKDFKKVSKEEAKYIGLNGIGTIGTVIGEGDVNVCEVVKTLHQDGYTGNLSIEYEGESSLENIEKSIKNALQYLSEINS